MDKLNAIIFLLFKPAGRGKNKADFIPYSYQIEAFCDLVLKNKAKCKLGMDSCLVNWVVTYQDLNSHQMMSLDTCESSRMSVYISPDMVMMPCSFSNEKEYGVKIDEKRNIDYIWNRSMNFKRFRSILKKQKNCCPAIGM